MTQLNVQTLERSLTLPFQISVEPPGQMTVSASKEEENLDDLENLWLAVQLLASGPQSSLPVNSVEAIPVQAFEVRSRPLVVIVLLAIGMMIAGLSLGIQNWQSSQPVEVQQQQSAVPPPASACPPHPFPFVPQ